MVSKRMRSNHTNSLTKSLWQTLTDNKTQNDEALFYINAKFDTVSHEFISWVFWSFIPYLLKLRTQVISAYTEPNLNPGSVSLMRNP